MVTYENLAIAIVKQAARDWISAMRKLKKKPDDKKAHATRIETEHFFRSEWFEVLTNVDGEVILARLEEEL